MKTEWISTNDKMPEYGQVVHTKIDTPIGGVRNEQALKKMGNLWYYPDSSMYVYYTSTHWRPLIN